MGERIALAGLAGEQRGAGSALSACVWKERAETRMTGVPSVSVPVRVRLAKGKPVSGSNTARGQLRAERRRVRARRRASSSVTRRTLGLSFSVMMSGSVCR